MTITTETETTPAGMAHVPAPFPATAEPYLKTRELLLRFNISQRTLSRLLLEGCPRFDIGASKPSLRFKASEFEAWLTARARRSQIARETKKQSAQEGDAQ